MKNKIILSLVAIIILFGYAGDLQAAATRNLVRGLANRSEGAARGIKPRRFSTFSAQEPWEVLGVSQNATEKEAETAYKNLMKQWHPDRNKTPQATEMTKKINKARNDFKQYSQNKNSSESYQDFNTRTSSDSYKQQEQTPKQKAAVEEAMRKQKAQEQAADEFGRSLSQILFGKSLRTRISHIKPTIDNLKKATEKDNIRDAYTVFKKGVTKDPSKSTWKNFENLLRNQGVPASAILKLRAEWYTIKVFGYSIPIAATYYGVKKLTGKEDTTEKTEDSTTPNEPIVGQSNENADDQATTSNETTADDQTAITNEPTADQIEQKSSADSNEAQESATLPENQELTSQDLQVLDKIIETELNETSDATSINPNELPAQPASWWDGLIAGGNYLADSANNALTSTIELATANPVITGAVATGLVAATGGYLYNKYYKSQPLKPAEPIFTDEQEPVSE